MTGFRESNLRALRGAPRGGSRVSRAQPVGEQLVASLVRFHHGNLLAALGRIEDAMEIYRDNVARSQRERQAYDLYGRTP
jgi:hypothetical protein